MPFLLAQLVAPPTQQGPIRLPGPVPIQEPAGPDKPSPRLELPTPAPTRQPTGTQAEPGGQGLRTSPTSVALPFPIEGITPYSNADLVRILGNCPSAEACSRLLRQQLLKDGYINTQVVPTRNQEGLRVLSGRLERITVDGPSSWLNRRVKRLLGDLVQQPLRLPVLEQQLRLLQLQPGVKTVNGRLTSINDDPQRAQLLLTVTPARQPLRGDFSIRNDGSNSSGQFRATGVLLQNSLALPGDSLLLYSELDSTDAPQIGAFIGSVSYTVPLGDTLGLTASYGYNNNTPFEYNRIIPSGYFGPFPYVSPLTQLTTNQYQGQLQLEWAFQESLLQRWSLTAALVSNENRLTYNADPCLSYTQIGGWPGGSLCKLSFYDFYGASLLNPKTGFVRLGLNANGLSGRVSWFGTAYLLQGIGSMTPDDQLRGLAAIGIDPAAATAFGGLASANWQLSPRWQLNLRLGGQIAINPLTSPMQFTLGSDVGIRGLPGQLVSGDSGWLSSGEAVWTVWQKKNQALQLIPFIGAGGVYTNNRFTSLNDIVGSGGLLARWLAGDHFSLELGYAHTFATDNNQGPWNNWLLGSGLYTKASYRF